MAFSSVERRRQLTLAACVLGSALAFIDASVVIVALPTIEADLNLGLSGQQWVFLSYSLALAALYLPGGALGDRYGRRNVFMAGAAGFAVASMLAGFAPNGTTLIVARTLQGVAGAFLTTNSLALLRGVYKDNAGHAIGLWTALTSVATIGGPPAGGWIVDVASWRWIFFINLPLAIAAVVLALLGRCDEGVPEKVRGIDVGGTIFAAVGFGMLTYGVVEGASKGFDEVWWALAIAVISLAAFVVVERRTKEPMLPFELFRRRNFAAANGETFLVYAALWGFFFYFTLYLQALGFSAKFAGFALAPPSLVLVFLAPRFGALADKHGPRLYLTIGPALIGAGALASTMIKSKSDFWVGGTTSLILFSLGLSILVAPITTTALKSAPTSMAGIASGVNSTVSRLGSLMAVATMGALVSVIFERHTDSGADPLAEGQTGTDLSASITAYRGAMLFVAALALAGALVGALAISNRDALTTADVKEPEPAPAPAGS